MNKPTHVPPSRSLHATFLPGRGWRYGLYIHIRQANGLLQTEGTPWKQIQETSRTSSRDQTRMASLRKGTVNHSLHDEQELTSERGSGGRGQCIPRGPEAARLLRKKARGPGARETAAATRTQVHRFFGSRIRILLFFPNTTGSYQGILSRGV